MSFRPINQGSAFKLRLTSTAAAGTGWVKVAAMKGKNLVAEAIWSTASTAGTTLRLEGTMTTASTASFLLTKFTQATRGQTASTSGAAAKALNYVRVKTTAGKFSAAKWGDVWVVGLST